MPANEPGRNAALILLSHDALYRINSSGASLSRCVIVGTYRLHWESSLELTLFFEP